MTNIPDLVTLVLSNSRVEVLKFEVLEYFLTLPLLG